MKIDFKLCPPDQSRKCPPSIWISKDPCYQAVWPKNWIKFRRNFWKIDQIYQNIYTKADFWSPKQPLFWPTSLVGKRSAGLIDRKHLVLVHFFNFIRGNHCLQYYIQILTLLSLASFILPASLIAEIVDQWKSKMEL